MKKFALIGFTVSWTVSLFAYDAGPHQDLTAGVMQDFAFSSDAVGIARLNNWLVDYYSANGDYEKELQLLHFDNLPTTHMVKVYWGYFTNNTRRALQAAALANDPFKALCLLGMSLHAVQDFYSHSTWPETHAGLATAYRAETFFTDPPADNNIPQTGLYTGLYPGGDPAVPGDAAKYHGSYTWGVNHDNYNRPRHDESFVFAYSATVQWIRAMFRWVELVRPGFFNSMKNFVVATNRPNPYRPIPNRPDLDRDLKFLYYLSNWTYDPGIFGFSDGRWKMLGSGAKADFLLCLIAWVRTEDDAYILSFKAPLLWFRELTPGLDNLSGLVPAVEPLPKPNIARRAIVLKTVSVSDDTFLGLDNGLTSADFYARLRVGNQQIIEPCFRNGGSGAVLWRTVKLVPKSLATVKCTYALWEEDIYFLAGDFQSSDDHCDINPTVRKLDLDFVFDTATHRCTGDVVGIFDNSGSPCLKSGTEKNKSSVTFYITEYPVIEP